MSIFIAIVVFIVGLGVVICLHEAGHFSMAKLFKVYCEEFSIGFGPKIISINPKDKVTGKKRWETTLNIRLLPLGGYVAMVGEEEGDGSMTEAGQEPIPKERTFSGVNRGKQAIVMIAGIVMNIVLSYFLFLLGNAFGRQQDPYSNRIRLTENSALAASGIKTGDQVEGMIIDLGTLKYDEEGKLLPDSDLKIVDGYGNEADYKALEDAGIFDIKVNYTVRTLGDSEYLSLLDDDLSRAWEVDLVHDEETGDDYYQGFNYYTAQTARIITLLGVDDEGETFNVKADGTRLDEEDDDSSLALRYAPNREDSAMTIKVAYLGDDDSIVRTGEAEVPASVSEIENEDGTTSTQVSFGQIGVQVYMSYMPDPDKGIAGSDTITPEAFGKAIVQSFVDQGLGIRDVYLALGSLFTPKGWNNVGGIVSIFITNQQAVNMGFYYVMWVWGLISVNLAVLNLLPIPGLDGWQLLLCIIEAIIRKPLPSKFKSVASTVGLTVLILFAIALVVLDCIRAFA